MSTDKSNPDEGSNVELNITDPSDAGADSNIETNGNISADGRAGDNNQTNEQQQNDTGGSSAAAQETNISPSNTSPSNSSPSNTSPSNVSATSPIQGYMEDLKHFASPMILKAFGLYQAADACIDLIVVATKDCKKDFCKCGAVEWSLGILCLVLVLISVPLIWILQKKKFDFNAIQQLTILVAMIFGMGEFPLHECIKEKVVVASVQVAVSIIALFTVFVLHSAHEGREKATGQDQLASIISEKNESLQ